MNRRDKIGWSKNQRGFEADDEITKSMKPHFVRNNLLSMGVCINDVTSQVSENFLPLI